MVGGRGMSLIELDIKDGSQKHNMKTYCSTPFARVQKIAGCSVVHPVVLTKLVPVELVA